MLKRGARGVVAAVVEVRRAEVPARVACGAVGVGNERVLRPAHRGALDARREELVEADGGVDRLRLDNRVVGARVPEDWCLAQVCGIRNAAGDLREEAWWRWSG
eukprot:5911144-Prymnesium_polylepis.4